MTKKSSVPNAPSKNKGMPSGGKRGNAKTGPGKTPPPAPKKSK